MFYVEKKKISSGTYYHRLWGPSGFHIIIFNVSLNKRIWRNKTYAIKFMRFKVSEGYNPFNLDNRLTMTEDIKKYLNIPGLVYGEVYIEV